MYQAQKGNGEGTLQKMPEVSGWESLVSSHRNYNFLSDRSLWSMLFIFMQGREVKEEVQKEDRTGESNLSRAEVCFAGPPI